MKGDFHVRFCGKARVRFPCLTRLEETIELHETQRNRIKNYNNLTTKTKNNEKTTQIITAFFYVDKLSQKLFTRI